MPLHISGQWHTGLDFTYPLSRSELHLVHGNEEGLTAFWEQQGNGRVFHLECPYHDEFPRRLRDHQENAPNTNNMYPRDLVITVTEHFFLRNIYISGEVRLRDLGPHGFMRYTGIGNFVPQPAVATQIATPVETKVVEVRNMFSFSSSRFRKIIKRLEDQ